MLRLIAARDGSLLSEHVVADEYDSPWKQAIEHYFADFLHFYFPTAHAAIDWSQPIIFLEQELRKVARDAELGMRFVDIFGSA